MQSTFDNSITGFKKKILRNITLFIFYILPKRATSIYVSLSIVALIYNLKDKKFVSGGVNCIKLSKVLQIAVDDEIMILPNITMGWLWNESLLDKNLVLNNNTYSIPLKLVITNDELFFKHIRSILDTLIDSLPKSLKNKLNLKNIESRLLLKHNVMEALMYA